MMPPMTISTRLYRAQEGQGPVLVFFSPLARRQWIERAPDLRHVVRYRDRPRNAPERAFIGVISTARIHPTRRGSR